MPSDHNLSCRCLITQAVEQNGSQATDCDHCVSSMGHRGSSLSNALSVDREAESTVTPSPCPSPTMNNDETSIHPNGLERQIVTSSNANADETTVLDQNGFEELFRPQVVTPPPFSAFPELSEMSSLGQQVNGNEYLLQSRAPPTPPPFPVFSELSKMTSLGKQVNGNEDLPQPRALPTRPRLLPVAEFNNRIFEKSHNDTKKDKEKLLVVPDRPVIDGLPERLREWVPPVIGPPTVPCRWFVVGVLPEADIRSRFVARIVHLSDTHDSHEKIKIPDGDVLIHSGDFFTWHDSKVFEKDAVILDKFFAKQHHKYKIFVAGNHEMSFCKHSPEKIQQHLPHVVYLHDSETTVTGGLRVYGAPWTIERYTPATAFQDNPYRTGMHWKNVPTGIDILVTHSPPQHLLDDHGKCGCPTLQEHVLKRIRPRMHLFGHAHHNATAAFYDGILFSNGTVGERALGNSVPAVIDVYLPPSANDE